MLNANALGTYHVIIEYPKHWDGGYTGSRVAVVICEAAKDEVLKFPSLIAAEILMYDMPRHIVERVIRYGLKLYGVKVLALLDYVTVELVPETNVENTVVVYDHEIQQMPLDSRVTGEYWMHWILEDRGIVYVKAPSMKALLTSGTGMAYHGRVPKGTAILTREVSGRTHTCVQTYTEPEHVRVITKEAQ